MSLPTTGTTGTAARQTSDMKPVPIQHCTDMTVSRAAPVICGPSRNRNAQTIVGDVALKKSTGV
jgi:hypothetical protein